MTVANPFTDQGLPGPRLTPAEAVALAAEAFGVHGEARELGSQQDQNFRLDTPAGRFVLKISSPAFTASELDLQDRAMAHVAARLGKVVPVAIQGVAGTEIVRAGEHDVRLLSYLEGDVLHAAGYHAPAVLGAAGGLVAQVAAALADFDHPAADRVLQWDVARAAEVVEAFAPWTRDAARRALLERTMGRASAALEPLAAALRRQVIHGDANDQNVLAQHGADGRPEPVAACWTSATSAARGSPPSARCWPPRCARSAPTGWSRRPPRSWAAFTPSARCARRRWPRCPR